MRLQAFPNCKDYACWVCWFNSSGWVSASDGFWQSSWFAGNLQLLEHAAAIPAWYNQPPSISTWQPDTPMQMAQPRSWVQTSAAHWPRQIPTAPQNPIMYVRASVQHVMVRVAPVVRPPVVTQPPAPRLGARSSCKAAKICCAVHHRRNALHSRSLLLQRSGIHPAVRNISGPNAAPKVVAVKGGPPEAKKDAPLIEERVPTDKALKCFRFQINVVLCICLAQPSASWTHKFVIICSLFFPKPLFFWNRLGKGLDTLWSRCRYTPFWKCTFCVHCFVDTRQLFESDLGFSSHRQGTKKASSWLISAVRIGPLAQLLAPFRFRPWNSWKICRSGVPNLKANQWLHSSVSTPSITTTLWVGGQDQDRTSLVRLNEDW